METRTGSHAIVGSMPGSDAISSPGAQAVIWLTRIPAFESTEAGSAAMWQILGRSASPASFAVGEAFDFCGAGASSCLAAWSGHEGASFFASGICMWQVCVQACPAA
jgi:hypothetical protein